jgi:hypothetical protein
MERQATPKCHYCGRTVPKYRRPYSDFCTLDCAKSQDNADAYSRAMEKDIQESVSERSMQRPTMQEVHARGGHRKVPSQRCPECKAARTAQWRHPSPTRRINEALEAKRAPQQ